MKKLNKILFALVLLLLPLVVSAKIVEADDNLKFEGIVDSTKFLFGNTVNNSADINGIGFIAGNTINSKGSSDYALYAGNVITVGDELEKDLFVAGNDITISEDAYIPRDAYIAGNSIKIYTEIGRNLYVGSEEIDLRGVTVKGDAYVEAEKILVDENTTIAGTLSYPENVTITDLDKANVAKTERIKDNVKLPNKKERIKNRVISFLTGIVVAYVTLLVLFLLFPKFKKAVDDKKETVGGVALTALTGLATLIVVPVLAILALTTVILIPLSLMTVALYIAAIYLATIISSYLIGRLLYSKLSSKSNMYLELLIGIVVVKLVSLIPYAGGIVLAICLFYGIGREFNLLKNSFGKK